jgi:large subunit ribosomal protein L4
MKENIKIATSKMDVYSLDGRMVEKIEVPKSLLDMKVDTNLLHQVIHWQLSKRRSGNHQTKNRSQINLSTRKIMKQKGSGRARHCTKAANIFRGGAKVFGPVTRSHEININKKVKSLGLKMAINQAIKTNVLYIIDSFENAEPKTKFWTKQCLPWHNQYNGCLLIGDPEKHNNIIRAINNIHYCNFLDKSGLNAYDIVKNGTVLIAKDTLFEVIERLNYE